MLVIGGQRTVLYFIINIKLFVVFFQSFSENICSTQIQIMNQSLWVFNLIKFFDHESMVYTKHKFTRAAKGIVLEEIVIKLYQLFL